MAQSRRGVWDVATDAAMPVTDDGSGAVGISLMVWEQSFSPASFLMS